MIQLDSATVAILITILGSLIAFSFGYGVLTMKVKSDRYDIEELKSSYKQIDSKLDSISNQVSILSAKLPGCK